MKPVTDPALLAELNGTPSAGSPVTDPALLALLNSDAPADVPRGTNAPAPSFYDQLRESLMGAKSVAGEFANAANRSIVQGADFMGPGTANAVLRVAGVDAQLPTFAEGFDQLPGAQGGFMAPGTARDVVRGAGGAAPAALGLYPVAGRNLASPIGAAMDFMGFGAANPAPNVAPLAFGGLLPAPAGAPAPPATARLSDLFPATSGQAAKNELVRSG